MKTVVLIFGGLVIAAGIIAIVSIDWFDPQSYYVVKFYRSAVTNERAFREALHKADWRRKMAFRRTVDGEDEKIPDDPADDPTAVGEIKSTTVYVAGYVSGGHNMGVQVTQRAGYKNLSDLMDLLDLVTPTPTPTPAP